MPLEPIYTWAFFYSLLSTDATLIGATALNGLKIYKNRAPQGTAFPLIIGNLLSATDENTFNQQVRLIADQTWQWRVVGKVLNGNLENGTRVRVTANRLDALLKNKRRVSFTVDGVTYFFNTWRESAIYREEEGETVEIAYENYGGIYRAQAFV